VGNELITRRVHTDSGALTLLIINYVMALSSLLIINRAYLSIVRIILVTGLAALNFISLVRVHLSLVSKGGLFSYLLFLVNILPYAVLLTHPGPWLLIPIIPLVLFILEIVRGRGRSVIANASGTALIASSFIAWYVLMGGALTMSIIAISLMWVIYHSFNALYVEGKMPFRSEVKPWYSSVLWLVALPPLAYLMCTMVNPLFLFVLAEPTARALVAVRERKLSTSNLRARVRRIGVGLLIESLALAVLILVLLYIIS
jgi:hypothetical protein